MMVFEYTVKVTAENQRDAARMVREAMAATAGLWDCCPANEWEPKYGDCIGDMVWSRSGKPVREWVARSY